MVELEELATDQTSQVDFKMSAHPWDVAQWKKLAATGLWEGTTLHAEYAEAALQSLEKRRFLVVIRKTRWVEASEPEEGKLAPATLEGDVVVYDVRDKQVVAGFPINLQGSSKMAIRSKGGPAGVRFEESVAEIGRTDMRSKLGLHIAESMEALLPGCTPPYLESFASKEARALSRRRR